MAQKLFKGFMQVTEGTFSAETGYLYFVRKTTNTGYTDGYIQFNGKKYGTAAEAAADLNADIEAIETALGTLSGRVDTIETGYTTNATFDAYTAATDASIAALSGVSADTRISALEAISANTRIAGLEAVSADTRLDLLEADTHTHSNKSVLDGITSEKVSAWDAMADGAAVVLSAYTGENAGVTQGSLKTYEIFQGGVSVGKIDIPKDLVVTSGVVTADTQGNQVLRLTIANQSEPVDIAISDLAHVYSAGDGIEISTGDTVSAKVVAANGLSVDSNGIALAVADSANTGAMSAAYAEKLESIAASAQTNVLEGVQVNGSDVTIDANKKANIVLPSATVTGASNGVTVEVVQVSGSVTEVNVTAPDFDALSGRVGAIETGYTTNATFDAYTAATDASIAALSGVSADTRISALEAVSADTRLDALEALTGSTSSALQSISAGDNSVTVGTKDANNDQTVAAKISAASGNAISLENDGLFAGLYYDGDDSN